MRTTATIGACVIAVLVTAGCDGASSPREDPTTPSDGTSAEQWSMPNLVGAVLQDAQDQIQELTGGAVYFTDSHDVSGRGRNQVLDADWKVCSQNVEPDTALTPASKIDFGVVKLAETCP